ncbi:GDP-L-fucose synthase family protein [Desulfobulbus propionicus]|nr:GDP-L-fucose synthase [Desulfobulbus sp.]
MSDMTSISPAPSMLNPQTRIFVAGHRGMVGSAIVRRLQAEGFTNIITRTHKELDLTEHWSVWEFFREESIDSVVLAAAMVGGIHANNTYPADFITTNLQIQTNVISEACKAGIRNLLFLGSSCIYPKFAPQPMKEEYLLTGGLEPTNEPYAIAKIAGIKMCEAYNRQYGTRFIAVMPTNLYGPGDDFYSENSHVLPALLRRFHEAKVHGAPEVAVWGTGQARREFLHVDDMAAACLFVMGLPDAVLQQELLSYPKPCFVNVGTGEDLTIRELAETVARIVKYEGRLVFDSSKPEGTPIKLLDVSRLKALGWTAQIGLEQGIRTTYAWMLANGRSV